MSDTERISELERKLAEANHQIEKYAAEARQAIEAYETVFKEFVAMRVKEERDTLAEALDKIRRWGCTDGHCSHIAGEALAAVKGGDDEPYK